MDRREYVCNQMYKQHDLLRKGSWTDADKLEYMELDIAPYSRYWRMGMKKALKHAIRLLREEEVKADRKTEPQTDEFELFDREALILLIECQRERIAELLAKTEPQYDIDKGTIKCDNCSENGSYKCSKCDGEIYFKRLEVEDEPQTDCSWK